VKVWTTRKQIQCTSIASLAIYKPVAYIQALSPQIGPFHGPSRRHIENGKAEKL